MFLLFHVVSGNSELPLGQSNNITTRITQKLHKKWVLIKANKLTQCCPAYTVITIAMNPYELAKGLQNPFCLLINTVRRPGGIENLWAQYL